MTRRTPLLAAAALALSSVLPAGAATPAATATRYGTAKGFTLVGHTTLGNRGVNSPIAVAGRCVYVGDRYDQNGVAIVDAVNPAKPKQIGKIAPVRGATQRELRADVATGVLVVVNYALSIPVVAGANTIKTYDIRDCRKPKLLATYDMGARSAHEFFLWKDTKRPGRMLVYLANTIYSPDLEVVDLTDPSAPRLAAAFDLVADHAINPLTGLTTSNGGYLHSLSVSDDGTRAYMGGWDWGFYVLDTSALAAPLAAGVAAPVVRPVGGLPTTYGGNVHGGVKVPGRPYAVLVEEGYADPGAGGCPFGHLRTADLRDETAPKLIGEFKIQENDCAKSLKLNGTFTSHNQTLFPNVALVPWYAGGLRAVDISDPKRPRESGAFVPRRYFEPDRRDNRLYFPGADADPWVGVMWSYPVVQNGLIYVVDIDQGLFILRYTGKHAAEVARAGYVEGNSAPSRYTRKPVVVLPRTGAPPTVAPPVVLSPYRTVSVATQERARRMTQRRNAGFCVAG